MWITRVPAARGEMPAVLAQADPPTMTPRLEGYRAPQVKSASGGMPRRWLLVYSDHHRPQALCSGAQSWRKPSGAEAEALQPLCHSAYASAADAQQVPTTVAQALPATFLPEGTV